MPAVRPTQLKRSEDVVALCRHGAGPIEAFDAAAARLEPPERDLSLRALARHVRQAEDRLAVLEDVARAVEDLAAAAAYRAVVLGVMRANGDSAAAHGNGGGVPANFLRVHVAMLGQQMQLVTGVLPGAPLDALEVGDEVEVVQTGATHYAVRSRVGRHLRHGLVGRVEAIVPPDLLRVARGPDTVLLRAVGGVAEILQAASGTDGERALLGRLVSYDECLGLAFNLFGESERETLVVREFPIVQRAELVLAPRLVRKIEDEIILPLQYSELARVHEVVAGSFYVFEGPAGVGKTHTARWIASELGRPLYLINGGELADKWYGGSEAKLRARIRAARAEPNGAVLVWDEAESMLVERGRSLVGVEDRIVSCLLSETDGFLPGGDVLYLLTTNRADKIDSALTRALRAQTVRFERPDAPRTRALFRLYLGNDASSEELAQAATRAIFAEREPLARAVFADGVRVALTRAMAVSGALVRASCERARRRGFVRVARGTREAVSPTRIDRDDLLDAIADEMETVARGLTAANLAHIVTLPADEAERVVALEQTPQRAPNRQVGGP
jgi:hypothetical protein